MIIATIWLLVILSIFCLIYCLNLKHVIKSQPQHTPEKVYVGKTTQLKKKEKGLKTTKPVQPQQQTNNPEEELKNIVKILTSKNSDLQKQIED